MVSQTPTQCTNSYCGNLKHPLGLSRNSAANRSIQLRCMRLMRCLFSQDSTKSLGSKKELDESHTKRQTFHGTSKVYHKVGPLLLLMVPKNPAPVEVGRLSHYFQGFFTSYVVQEFFHQQYSCKRS